MNFHTTSCRLALLASLLLAACGGGGGSGGGTVAAPTGTLKVALADAPACGFDHVYVTVQKVRVNQNGSAADGDPGWVEIAPASSARIDLLALNNGVFSTLGQTALTTGHYTQIELVLAANGGAPPYANAVVPTGAGGTETALTTPSAQQSGLKINADITVNANQEVDFLLDFNACKSIVTAGASGKYLLKPVLTVTPLYLSGIQGYVNPAIPSSTVLVTAQVNGVVAASAVPDSTTGAFTLTPLAPNTNYDLVVASSGHATEVLTGVPVATALITSVNTSMNAFNPPASSTGVVSGTVTVTPPVAPILADVQVSQTLAGPRPIELVDRPVDATTGVYSYALPLAAPLVATYVPQPAIPSFTADTSAAAHYTLSAAYAGMVKPQPPVTVNGTTATTVNFSFP